MTDHAQRLRERLQELHEELEAVDELDPELRSMLEETLGDIRGRLAETEEFEVPAEPNEITRLAERFEEDHPTMAGLLRKLVDTLSQMGI